MQMNKIATLSLIALPLLLAGCGNQKATTKDSSSMVTSSKTNNQSNINSNINSNSGSSTNDSSQTSSQTNSSKTMNNNKTVTKVKNDKQTPLPTNLQGSYTTTLKLKVEDMNNKPIGNAVVPVVLHIQKNKVAMGTGTITATGTNAKKIVKTMNSNMFNSNPGYADVTNVKSNNNNQATAQLKNDMGLYDITDTQYYNGNISFELTGGTLNAEIAAGNDSHGAKNVSLAAGIVSVLSNTNNNSNFYIGTPGSFTKISDQNAKSILSANKQFLKGYGY